MPFRREGDNGDSEGCIRRDGEEDDENIHSPNIAMTFRVELACNESPPSAEREMQRERERERDVVQIQKEVVRPSQGGTRGRNRRAPYFALLPVPSLVRPLR